MDRAEQIEKYEEEIRRLAVLDAELDVLLSRAPRYALAALLAPVVWYFAGGGWAFAELLVTAALLGTQTYLLKVRKSENEWNRKSLVEDVRRLRAEQVWESERPSAG
jgi:4-hydroxybenzoate polyprenyltransferase